MARILPITFVFCLSLMVVDLVRGDEIKLINNTVYEGEISDVNEDGIVVRLDAGGYSSRISWLDLSQETLKKLIADRGVDSEAAFYAEPYIEIPRQERMKQQEINVNPVPRVERPNPDIGFFATLMTPMGIVILGVLFFANIFIAYEIAAYRNQSSALVCAISAVLPVLGPIIFLSLPSAEHYEEAEEEAPAPAPPPPPRSTAPAGVGVPSGGGLSLAQQKGDAGGGGAGEAKVYSHKEHTFNRRFIESQFSGFFRVVPTPAEKDLVIVFKTVKHQYVAKRITRISSTDIHIQLLRGGGTNEVRIGFNEIVEIQVRHKDAK